MKEQIKKSPILLTITENDNEYDQFIATAKLKEQVKELKEEIDNLKNIVDTLKSNVSYSSGH